MQTYLPEGSLLSPEDNEYYFKSLANLKEAFHQNKTLQAKAILCDSDHNLIVDLGCAKGIILREDCALGIKEGTTRDIAIISRVGKHVCFKIDGFSLDENKKDIVYLSRVRAQNECMDEYVSNLQPGEIIQAKVTHLDSFGAFVDIGCGVVSLIPIDLISVSRISHPRDRFVPGQDIHCVVKNFSDDGKICLSHKELLGTWEENAQFFSAGQTVPGIIRSIEEYGIFVELAPNLAGLAEYVDDVKVGQTASVYIKSIIPEKMKIKLIIIDTFDTPPNPAKLQYFIDGDEISTWHYSPQNSAKEIYTEF